MRVQVTEEEAVLSQTTRNCQLAVMVPVELRVEAVPNCGMRVEVMAEDYVLSQMARRHVQAARVQWALAVHIG